MEGSSMIDHIKELCRQRGWTYYKLAKESGIPHSSLNTMLNKQHMPSTANLVKICDGFGITLSEFFAGMETVKPEHKTRETELLRLWNLMDDASKQMILVYMSGLAHQDIPNDLE